MGVHADINDWRLFRVRRFSLSLRVLIPILAAFLVFSTILDTGRAGLEGPGGYRLTLVGFQVQTQGEFNWQDLALFAVWVPVLGLGVALLHQVDRLLASYQGGVIVDAGNARRISRISFYIGGVFVLLFVGDLLEAALSASSYEGITIEWLWLMAALVFRAIGYAMEVACEIAEDAELTV